MSGVAVNILLVEDDELDVRIIKRALKQEKISNPIVVAKDGVEAIEILEGKAGLPTLNRPYLILLDLNMPRMNGLEFLETLRKKPQLKDSVVFVLTTSEADEDILAAYSFNVAGYLLKSRAGEDFLNNIKMLDNFLLTVQFPP